MGWLGCGWGQSATGASDAVAGAQIKAQEAAVLTGRLVDAPDIALAAQAFAFGVAAAHFCVGVEGVKNLFCGGAGDFDGEFAVSAGRCLFLVQFAGIDGVAALQPFARNFGFGRFACLC